jgi:cyclase
MSPKALILAILLLVCPTHSPAGQTAKKYVCKPCGCSKDHEVFDKPGKCPDCGMALAVQGATPSQEPPSEAADSVNTLSRKVTKLGEGVYEIRHEEAPDSFPQGNTTVVIGRKGVFVVDSCYLPSTAKQDIAQIRRWTKKPVLYLLNTHWHYDHVMGNGVYAAAFPGLTILSHTETRNQFKGYMPGYIARYPQRGATIKKLLDSGTNADGTPLTEDSRKLLVDELNGREAVWKEFKGFHAVLPTKVFDKELEIDLGGRSVQVKWLGRGNTLGDAIAYLPKERIVAAGDLIDHPVPYLGGGYPVEEIDTLQRLARLNPKLIVPGHGEVLHGTKFLNLEVAFLKDVVNHVSRAIYQVGNGSRRLEEVRSAVMKSLNVEMWRNRFAGSDHDNRDFFDSFSLQGLITAAWSEMEGR